jgi:hypothetical protein
MDSETSSNLILVAIIAAAILVPLVLIGALVLIFLPVVRRRRRRWQAAAASLGLQSDSMSTGTRGLLQESWRIEGARPVDMAASSSLDEMTCAGARACDIYCQALLEPFFVWA